jgi:hypothetical protein
MPKLAVLNLSRSFSADDYKDRALRGVSRDAIGSIDVIDGADDLSPSQLWQRLEKVCLLISSGSIANVGVMGEEGDLVPNLQSNVVSTVTTVFQFLIIQKLKGDPRAEKIHAVLNCFSAQAFAFAYMLVDTMLKQGVDLSEINSISDVVELHSPAQLIQDESFVFPIAQVERFQMGYFDHDLELPNTSVLLPFAQGAVRLPSVHGQAIRREVLESAHPSLQRRLHVLADRDLPIESNQGLIQSRIVALFEFMGMVGGQPHFDYDREDVDYLSPLVRSFEPNFSGVEGEPHHELHGPQITRLVSEAAIRTWMLDQESERLRIAL